MLQVFVHGAWTHPQDVGDVAVGFAFGQPGQHLGLAWGEGGVGQAVASLIRRQVQEQHGFTQTHAAQVPRHQGLLDSAWGLNPRAEHLFGLQVQPPGGQSALVFGEKRQ